MGKIKDITNKTFGRLTVIEIVGKDKHRCITWKCKCSCGKYTITTGTRLRSGMTKSCGCLVKENKPLLTHGLSKKTPEYFVWVTMRQRINNKKDKHYLDYGGRGLTISKEWDNYPAFLKDMGRRPNNKYSLERIDNNKGYSKNNCKWATAKEQTNNQRSNHKLTLNGKTQNISQWAEELDVPYSRILSRLRYGWSDERTLTAPLRDRI